jgi:acetate---CoA ligase (ADP-forming)
MSGVTADPLKSVIRHFVRPRSIAVVGASDRMDYGGRLLRNQREGGFAGKIFPVNSRRTEVQGMQAWPDVAELPEPVDLAVVVVPTSAVATIIESCGKRGVRACAVITAGFGERGAEGEQEQKQLVQLARNVGVRFSGPNSLGVANLTDRMFATASSNVTWGRSDLRPSGISLVSQSGALSFNPVPSRAAERGIGLRAIVSVGNQADLTVVDFIEYFVESDDETKAVALFLEGLPENEGRRLLQVAHRARALNKPILAVKVGRSPGTAAVARSHTAALTGDDAVYDGAFRSAYITRVADLDDLWETGSLLAAYPDFTPWGGVGFLSNSGGMNSLFADHCGVSGVPLAALSTDTIAGIETVLAGFGGAGNPADVTGNIARPALVDLIDLFTADAATDLVVVGTTGSAVGQRSLDIAGHVRTARAHTNKPFVTLWFSATGGYEPAKSGAGVLAEQGVPLFLEPSKCTRALRALYAYRRSFSAHPAALPALPSEIATGLYEETQQHALRLIASSGITVAELHIPASMDEAVAIAERVGYPVVLKIEALGLRHKTELGGVRVGIADASALRREWSSLWDGTAALGSDRKVMLQQQLVGGLELLLGSRIDPTFGPVIAFGAGGTTVEIERDLTFRPAPLDADTARDMFDSLRISRRFGRVRGNAPRDVDALVSAIVRFGVLADALAGRGAEIEINPLILRADGEGVCAVDARLTLRHSDRH